MEIEGAGNLCLYCMEEMGENFVCPHCGHDEQEPEPEEQSIPAGTLIGGHYLLGRTLGQGGFGITYLAYDLNLHVKRAIKEYFPQGLAMRDGNKVKVARQSMAEIYQKGVDSFYREAQAIARFGGHPNVVQVHSFFQENGTAYFVMDYVEGISFQQYLNQHGGRVPWEEALRILKPIGEALTALHESHLLHRDVKPDNIFISRNGTPKLLDFGAARYETSQSTHSSAAVLTPGFAPVEQYGSMTMQGAFTDVYALSATFYRAVSGTVPIPAPDRMETDALLPLDKVDSKISPQLSAAIAHGMNVRREKRTQTVADLLKELETPRKPKSSPWLLPAILAVMVIILGGGMWITLQSRQNSAEPASGLQIDELQNAQAGSLVHLGHYEQDNDLTNGEEALEWRVLTREGNRLLLLSEYGLEAKPFDTENDASDWESSTLRSWLNVDFYRNAFSAEERKRITALEENADEAAENVVQDRIFLLSREEAETYFPDAEDRLCIGTACAVSNGAYRFSNDTGAVWWWLRTSGVNGDAYTMCVSTVGSFNESNNNNESGAVRPALWLDLDAAAAEGAETAPVILAAQEEPVIADAGCYWFRNPDETSDKLGWLQGGTKVVLTGEKKTVKGQQWVNIESEKGIAGWVYNKNIASYETKAVGTNMQPGDSVYFGYYEQDNEPGNGAEPIQWRILAREENRVLLLSEYGLDARAYNTEKKNRTWEKCTLRDWLNGEFYETAFIEEEQERIVLTEVKAESNPDYGTDAGSDTMDKIFLLSVREAEQYFDNDSGRKSVATAYAEANGAYPWWWLRTPGSYGNIAAYVASGGSVNSRGYFVNYSSGSVRPALWLNL